MSHATYEHSFDHTSVAREVVTNIWKLTIPIPFPLRTVNVYVLVGPDGWVLIDTGMGTPDARIAFDTGLKHIGLRVDRLQAIVLTHHHPDHIGLSGELREQSGAHVYMHPCDIAGLPWIQPDTMVERFQQISRFLAQHGLPQTQLWYSQVSPDVLRTIINLPPTTAFTPVQDGQVLELAGEQYRIIWTPGHSDGLICLYRESDGILLATDHVLPRVTPNIGLFSEHDRQNPLGDYLDSLAKIRTLTATQILPGHGEPFSDLAGRIVEIIEHHHRRLTRILSLLEKQPRSAYQITEELFGELLTNDEVHRLATAEILAHMEYLRLHGRLQRKAMKDNILYYIVPSSFGESSCSHE